jgi:hypothetical protein
MKLKGLPIGDMRSAKHCDCTDNFPFQGESSGYPVEVQFFRDCPLPGLGFHYISLLTLRYFE